jgi:hypothetical protein
VTSEPPPQSTSRELTSSRSSEETHAGQGVAEKRLEIGWPSIFPFEEEKETEFQQPEESQHKMQAGFSYQNLSVASVDSNESISHDGMSLQSDSSSVKKQKKPRSYLRLWRPVVTTFDEVLVDDLRVGHHFREAAAAAAAKSATSNNKRSREDGSEERKNQLRK